MSAICTPDDPDCIPETVATADTQPLPGLVVQVTPHFAVHEFDLPEAAAAHYGCAGAAYPPEWRTERLYPLCVALEVLREALGGAAVTIISGFRTVEYDNARIAARHGHCGIAQNSQHHYGRAADIQVAGISAQEVHETALRLYKAGRLAIGGLGSYATFTHVDVRDGATLAQWSG